MQEENKEPFPELTKNIYERDPAVCKRCGDVPYRVYVGCACFEHEGTTYVYNDFAAVCAVCGEDVVVPWIEEYNKTQREKAVRDAVKTSKDK